MISAWALLRVSARPRWTSSWSMAIFFAIGTTNDERRMTNDYPYFIAHHSSFTVSVGSHAHETTLGYLATSLQAAGSPTRARAGLSRRRSAGHGESSRSPR